VGNYSLYHQEQRILSKESASQEKLQRKEEKKNVKPSKSPKQRKLNIIEKRELESLMDEIPAFEEQKQNLEDKLNLIGGDYQQVQETAQQLEELNQLIEEKTMRWLELEEIAEGEQS
jgi:ATP-binding cassette subfamily F protein uup